MRNTLLAAILLAISLVVSVSAGFQMVMDYQGQLTEPGGTPVAAGVYSITFSLYDTPDPVGGLPLWSSLVRQVAVADGMFSYRIGDSVALPYDLFGGDVGLWLGIQVGADVEMTPRTQLSAVPAAAVAASLNGDVRTSLGEIVVNDGRMGGPIDSTVIVTSVASTLDHYGHVTILKISNGGLDTTNMVGLFGDPDFINLTLGDGSDPDSGVVVQSAVDHKHKGHVTVLKISNGGEDTTHMVGLFGDPDFARVQVGDDNDPDSAMVVVSAVDHKHKGHVTVLKIANGGADTTEVIDIRGDADTATIKLTGGGGFGGSIILTADESTSARIGVNTRTPAFEIDVIGTICATGGMCTPSDRRLKEDIEPLSGAMSIIQSLEPVHYEWRHEEFPDRDFPNGNQIGFIAQDVQEVLPELVSEGSDGFYALDYAKLTPVLVGALKQQQETISDLQATVEELSEMVKMLLTANGSKPGKTLANSR